MTLRVTLPAGQVIEVRDAVEVPERLRRPVLAISAAVEALGDPPSDPAQQLELIRRAWTLQIVAVVADWSFSGPVTADTVDDLPGIIYDQIFAVTAVQRDGIRWSLIVGTTGGSDPKASAGASPSSDAGWSTPTPST